MAAENLDQAANEISDLPLDPPQKHIRAIGEALVNIFQIQHEIYRLRPDLRPDYLNEETPVPDGDLTPEQRKLVEHLTNDQIKTIDDALLSNTCDRWRKVARVVGATMIELPGRVKGIPDIYYSQRVRKLVEDGLLESQGNLSYMRFSEVRRPAGKDT
ncbi:MAG: DUF3658 domain-containing protein [Nitrospirota bacterium]